MTRIAVLMFCVAVMSIVSTAGVAEQAKPVEACPEGRRDDFNGAKLDRSRWPTVVRETSDLRLEQGHLVIPTTATDNLWDANNTANIVLQPLPQGPFTAAAKLTVVARETFQQAGLVVYGDDDNYATIVLFGGDTRYFVFLREEQGKPTHFACAIGGPPGLAPRCSGAKLDAAFPATGWVRLTSSDGKTLCPAYSADGVRFTDMPEPKSLEGLTAPKIGLISRAGTSGERIVVNAKFDWFELCRPATTQGSRE
jgi:cytochrome c